MKSLLFIVLFVFTLAKGRTQDVVLRYDTMSIICLSQIDTNSHQVLSTVKYFDIKGEYYYGENFPFYSLRSSINAKDKQLFYLDYQPIINGKTTNALLKAVRRAKSININNSTFFETNGIDSSVFPFVSCLKKEEVGSFALSTTKFVAAYFIIDSETTRGVSSPVFCSSLTILNKLPVILNVVKIIR